MDLLMEHGFGQFEWARFSKKGNREKYRNLQCAIVTENERRYNLVMQSFKINTDSTVISTMFTNDYEVGDEMYYRGKWWYIESVNRRTLEVNPQALLISKRNMTQYVLGLMVLA